MTVEIKNNTNQIVVALIGQFDNQASQECLQQLQPLFDNADKEIVIDCDKMTFISSSGLRILLSLRKAIKSRGGSLILEHLNSEVRNVFDITRFSTIFTIH